MNISSFGRAVFRKPGNIATVLALVLIISAGIMAPLLAPFDPNQQQMTSTLLTPSPTHWLGTDDQGRDLFSRLLFAIRIDMLVAVVAVGIAVVLGAPIGLLLGSSNRVVDRIGSIIVEAKMAIPTLIFVLAIVAVTGRGIWPAMIGFGIAFAVPMLRVVRGEVLAIKKLPFVTAARSAGVSSSRIVLRHILPEVVPVIVVQAAVLIPAAFLVEAMLSYLALSVQPPEASLGSMLMSAQQVALMAPWQVIAPGIALLSLALLFNHLADILLEELNPRPITRRLLNTARRPSRVERERLRAECDPVEEAADAPVLELDELQVSLRRPTGEVVPLVRDSRLLVTPGQIAAVIGESGSGKTLTAMSTVGLLPEMTHVSGGAIRIRHHDVTDPSAALWNHVRTRDIALIEQDPVAALDPTRTIGAQFAAMLKATGVTDASHARQTAVRLLTEVGVVDPEARLDAYVHQLSGGIAQRVMIAMALAREPKVLVADEATSALDATIQKQVLELFRELARTKRIAIVLVTHNMGVVHHVADTVHVMYAGRIVESGPAREVLEQPKHPYTEALVKAVPANRTRTDALMPTVPGDPPDPTAQAPGCSFAARCPIAADVCRTDAPQLEPIGARAHRCHFPRERVNAYV